jgi:hypothetical protein
MIKSSTVSALTTVLLFWLVTLTWEGAETDTRNMALSVVYVSVFIFSVSFGLCLFLLLFLGPIFKRFSAYVSLPIFIVIGFSIPALMLVVSYSMPEHGQTPILYTKDTIELVIDLLSIGFIGLGSALSAWYGLRWFRYGQA